MNADLAVLQALLGVEQALVSAYERFPATALSRAFASQEREHQRALTDALRGLGAPARPSPWAPAAGRLKDVRTEQQALDRLLLLEGLAERAYFTAIPRLGDPALVRTAAQIMASEAQHAALLYLARHAHDPARAVPSAFVEGRR